jgi:hypothetical protein
MGHSQYDPAFAERRPWKAARKPGAKRAFKPQQVWAIRFYLDRERRLRAEARPIEEADRADSCCCLRLAAPTRVAPWEH